RYRRGALVLRAAERLGRHPGLVRDRRPAVHRAARRGRHGPLRAAPSVGSAAAGGRGDRVPRVRAARGLTALTRKAVRTAPGLHGLVARMAPGAHPAPAASVRALLKLLHDLERLLHVVDRRDAATADPLGDLTVRR